MKPTVVAVAPDLEGWSGAVTVYPRTGATRGIDVYCASRTECKRALYGALKAMGR